MYIIKPPEAARVGIITWAKVFGKEKLYTGVCRAILV
jgi:hypothetical protein